MVYNYDTFIFNFNMKQQVVSQKQIFVAKNLISYWCTIIVGLFLFNVKQQIVKSEKNTCNKNLMKYIYSETGLNLTSIGQTYVQFRIYRCLVYADFLHWNFKESFVYGGLWFIIPPLHRRGYTVLPLSILPSVPRYFSSHFSQQLLMAEI